MVNLNLTPLRLIEPASPSLDAVYENDTNLAGKKIKRLKIYGTAVVCDRPGINGRSYPLDIMKREAHRYTEKFIKGGRSSSELNHPRLNEKGEGKDYSVFEINLTKVCCLIESLKFQGKNMLIKMRVVEEHPAGQMLKALIDAGLRPGVSLRGAGSVIETPQGYYEVTDDYRLITVDVVGNPSFDDDAMMDSMYESIKGGKVQILTESMNIATQEFMQYMNTGLKIETGRKEYDRKALIHLCESAIQ